MKGKKDLLINILIIILIILTITLISCFIYFKIYNKDYGKEINELHNYFNVQDLNSCDGLVNYSNKKIDYSSLDDEIKVCIAYNKANHEKDKTMSKKTDKNKNVCTINKMVFKSEDKTDCNISLVEKSRINKIYKKIFGNDIVDLKQFKPDNFHVCYLSESDYYCGLSEEATYIIGDENSIYRIINKVVEKSNKIIIYDTFIKTDSNYCYKYYTTNDVNVLCNNKYKGKKLSYSFIKKYGTKYKHVYKKDNDNSYYWISSEPV